MLVLSRKIGESVKIGNDVEVMIVRLATGSVGLGFKAPREVKILRNELDEHEGATAGTQVA